MKGDYVFWIDGYSIRKNLSRIYWICYHNGFDLRELAILLFIVILWLALGGE